MATLSACMANYNHSAFLPRALDALLAQSRQPDEVLVIDDCSSDASIDVIESYRAKFARLRVQRNPRNVGVVRTANRLLELSTSEYFLAIAADDWLLPGMIEKSMALLEEHPAAGLCSSLTRVVDDNGGDHGVLFPSPFGESLPTYLPVGRVADELMHYGPWFCGNTTVYKRKALLESGRFRPELGPFCDGFVSQVIALTYGACLIPEPLAVWRMTGSNYSSNSRTESADRAIEAAVLALMRDEYSNAFPGGYPEIWRRRWVHSRWYRRWEDSLRNTVDVIESELCSFSAFEHFVSMTLKGMTKCGFKLANAVALASIRRHDLSRIFYRRALRAAKRLLPSSREQNLRNER